MFRVLLHVKWSVIQASQLRPDPSRSQFALTLFFFRSSDVLNAFLSRFMCLARAAHTSGQTLFRRVHSSIANPSLPPSIWAYCSSNILYASASGHFDPPPPPPTHRHHCFRTCMHLLPLCSSMSFAPLSFVACLLASVGGKEMRERERPASKPQRKEVHVAACRTEGAGVCKDGHLTLLH